MPIVKVGSGCASRTNGFRRAQENRKFVRGSAFRRSLIGISADHDHGYMVPDMVPGRYYERSVEDFAVLV
jgi:hypothetical protein